MYGSSLDKHSNIAQSAKGLSEVESVEDLKEKKKVIKDRDHTNKLMRSHHVHPFLTRDEIRHLTAGIKRQSKLPVAPVAPSPEPTPVRVRKIREKQRDISFRARREESFRFKFSQTINPHVRQGKQYSKQFNQQINGDQEGNLLQYRDYLTSAGVISPVKTLHLHRKLDNSDLVDQLLSHRSQTRSQDPSLQQVIQKKHIRTDLKTVVAQTRTEQVESLFTPKYNNKGFDVQAHKDCVATWLSRAAVVN